MSSKGVPTMASRRRFVAILLAALPLSLGFQSSATAATVQPCLTNAADGIGGPAIKLLPINGGGQTYCQSAFGWSDTWFATSQPASYNSHLDVLSGDNAPDLKYTKGTVTVGSGNQYNFISPWLDGGTLNSHFIGSDWKVVNDINVVGNVGTSTISLGGTTATTGLVAAITTTVGVNGVTEAFHFTNNTGDSIDKLLFSDYYNFHANGSMTSDLPCPTTTFDAGTGTVTTTGKTGGGCSAIVSNGTMQGSQLPSTWDLGKSTDVLAHIAAGTYNNAVGPFTGDGAIDMVWDLGSLANGASVDFTIKKNFVPINVAEPSSLAVLGTGLLGLGFLRRRRPQDGLTRQP